MTARDIARLALPLAGLMALAACHHTISKTDDQRTAEGHILPGSISDAMLPYDTVHSQPPAAPRGSALDALGADAATAGDAQSGDAAPASADAAPGA